MKPPSDRARRNRKERNERTAIRKQEYTAKQRTEQEAEERAAQTKYDVERQAREAAYREEMRKLREAEEYSHLIGLMRGRDGLPLPALCPGEQPLDRRALRWGWEDGLRERQQAMTKLVGLLKWRARLLGDPPTVVPDAIIIPGKRRRSGRMNAAWIAMMIAMASGGMR